MTIQEFIKISLLKPNKIWTILTTPLKKTKGICFLLVLIVSLPNFVKVTNDLQQIVNNVDLVENRFPSFSVQDSQLTTDVEKGFIYRSDVLNVLFDPSGTSTDNDVYAEASQGVPTIGFLKEHLVLNTILNDIAVPYSELDGFNNNMLHEMIQEFQSNRWIILLAVLGFVFIYNSAIIYIILIIAGFTVRLLTALFMGAWIQMPPLVSRQLTIAAALLPATLYAVIGLLGLGGGVGLFMYLLFTTTLNWLLGMREFISQQNKNR